MSDNLYGVFETLKNKDEFRKVFIDEIGNIAWDIDSSIHWNIGNKAIEQTTGIVVDVK